MPPETRCIRCGRVLAIGWFEQQMIRAHLIDAVCQHDTTMCQFIAAHMAMEPPAVYEDDEDGPPIDIHTCHVCGGHGQVVTGREWETGAVIDEECRACGGTGELPNYEEVHWRSP